MTQMLSPEQVSSASRSEVLDNDEKRRLFDKLPSALQQAVKNPISGSDDFRAVVRLMDAMINLQTHKDQIGEKVLEDSRNDAMRQFVEQVMGDIDKYYPGIDGDEVHKYIFEQLVAPVPTLALGAVIDDSILDLWEGKEINGKRKGGLRESYLAAERIVASDYDSLQNAGEGNGDDAQNLELSSDDRDDKEVLEDPFFIEWGVKELRAKELRVLRDKVAKKTTRRAFGVTGLRSIGLKKVAGEYKNAIENTDDIDAGAEHQALQGLLEDMIKERRNRSWLLKYGRLRNRMVGEGVSGNEKFKSSKKRRFARLVGHTVLMYGVRAAGNAAGVGVAIGVGVIAAETMSEYAGRLARDAETVSESFAGLNELDEILNKANENRRENLRELRRAAFSTRHILRLGGMAIGWFGGDIVQAGHEMYEKFVPENIQDSISGHGGAAAAEGVSTGWEAVANAASEGKSALAEKIGEIDMSDMDMPFAEHSDAGGGDIGSEAHEKTDGKPEGGSAESGSAETKTETSASEGATETKAGILYDKPVEIKPGDGLTNIVNRMTEGGPGSAAPMIQQAMDMGLGDVKFPDGTMLIEMQDGEPHLTKAGVMPKEAVDILARAADAKGYDLAA